MSPTTKVMSAGYVLVNVEPGSESDVYKMALTLDCVTDANMLFGDYDLIIKIEADNMGDIARQWWNPFVESLA